MPPRVYVDNRTLIREVPDLCTLQRGDHCLIAINFVRAASPRVDYFVSWLGSIEICYLYHHFIVMDDVDHVDESGVPRNSNGDPAMIFECGNTVPEACQELKSKSKGRPLMLPFIIAHFLITCKAKFSTHPLADYGDTPHIYVVLDRQTAEERERTVAEALRVQGQHDRYHVLFNNCEHICNQIITGFHKSEMVTTTAWVAFRVLLILFGVLALKMNQDFFHLLDLCYSNFCVDFPKVASDAYLFFTVLPVGLQAMISYFLLMRSVRRKHKQALIDRHECYHLLGKELGRMVVVGGMTIAAIYLTPQIVSNFLVRFVICALAYMVADMVYNCSAHAVMRLVLLPAYGRVWLLGAPMPDGTRNEACGEAEKKVN